LACLLIQSLTWAESLPSRGLSIRPLVYLGQVSYALYLVHTTPLARLIDPLFSSSPIVFYGVMNLVSAGFYQWVERPGRNAVLSAGAWLYNRWFKVPGTYNSPT
jgi:peptidoglycan/LPS O-acetylase OafA/YrhL